MRKPGTRRRNRPLLWLEIFLLGAGIGGLAIWTASLVIPALWERWANSTFDHQVQERSAHRPKVHTNDLVGRLSIPRLNLTTMVREGDKETTLSLAAGHIPGTAFPGQRGNVGVAGHRDAIFRVLSKIQKDDLIKFETVDGNYVYKVEETEIVKPTDVAVLNPSNHQELTLVTCYPFY
jgi:LPXTG-site transpeptidase (sortase) family protein